MNKNTMIEMLNDKNWMLSLNLLKMQLLIEMN